MARSPRYKVYDEKGDYVAACKFPSDAAAVVGLYGEGATIRVGHRVRDTVWTEVTDGYAGDSYDQVAETVLEREAAR